MSTFIVKKVISDLPNSLSNDELLDMEWLDDEQVKDVLRHKLEPIFKDKFKANKPKVVKFKGKETDV